MIQRQKGWTLIELMIAMLFVAILMGMSVSSYRDYTQRAHRANATIALMRIAAQQERFFLQNGTYASNTQMTVAPPGGLGFSSTSEGGDYEISIAPHANGLDFGYTITAVPAADGSQYDDTKCTAFTLNQNGLKGANGGHDPADLDTCWR